MLLLLSTTLAVAAAAPAPAPADSLACRTMMTDRMPLNRRVSTLDSISFSVGNAAVKLCYGRPTARGRTMIGGDAVPYGKLWRTGANEPTMIHTTGPLVIGGVAVPAGSYSLYTIPGASEWHVILNRSISQWGHESQYSAEVKAQEVGHGSAKASAIADHVERLTFRSEAAGSGVSLLLEWEKTRVTIPVTPGK